jgi:uncharacterized protein (TIGR02588 family)
VSDDRPAGAARRPIPVTEWIVAGIGAALVAVTIGYLVWLATTRDATPPDLRVVAHRVLALPGGWLVEFRASNQGTEPAAQVVVEGELRGPGDTSETSEATVDYLPARSTREGGLLFSRDPRRGELRLRAKSYVQP